MDRRTRPGPRVAVAVEGAGSYGAGLTRALEAAALTVIECEQLTRSARRGKGKSDAIDAHLPCSTPCSSTPTGYPPDLLTVTGRPCGCC